VDGPPDGADDVVVLVDEDGGALVVVDVLVDGGALVVPAEVEAEVLALLDEDEDDDDVGAEPCEVCLASTGFVDELCERGVVVAPVVPVSGG